MLGSCDGVLIGVPDGDCDSDGPRLGNLVGKVVGEIDSSGGADGASDGPVVPWVVGDAVEGRLGTPLGVKLRQGDGAVLGSREGVSLG